MNVLIIGGTGITGPFIVRRLVALGHHVTVFHRGTSEAELPAEVAHIHGDREAIESEADRLRAQQPEVVLDMSSLAGADTEAVMRVFSGVARRIVGISSGDVYRAFGILWGKEQGELQPVPLAEDAALRSVHFLEAPGREKLLAERAYLSDLQLPGTVLRYPMVYGPNDGGRIVDLLTRFRDGRRAILLDERLARWRWSRGYAENVAHATVLAVLNDHAAGRIYNMAEPEALPMAEWVRRVGEACDWHGPIIPLPPEDLPDHLRSPLNWSQHVTYDTQRIRNELGYSEPVPPDEALLRTVDWWRTAPPGAWQQFARGVTSDQYAAEDAILAALGV